MFLLVMCSLKLTKHRKVFSSHNTTLYYKLADVKTKPVTLMKVIITLCYKLNNICNSAVTFGTL